MDQLCLIYDTKVTGTCDGRKVLDVSAHLLSRGSVSQSASVTSVVRVTCDNCVCGILREYRASVK